MNRRLSQFLTAENISQSQFAEIIGVAKASVSHVLSGRNKPGYDFIENLALHYPDLSIEWLLTGKGKMYRNSKDVEIPESPSTSKDPVEIFNSQEPTLFEKEPEKVENEEDTLLFQSESEKDQSRRNIRKVVIFYDDGTYTEVE